MSRTTESASAIEPSFNLVEDSAACARHLRALAERWRDRVEFGQIGGHAREEVDGFIGALERASVQLTHLHAPPAAVIVEILDQSEERFRLLVEGVDEYAIVGLDVGGRVTSWNAAATRISLYTAEETLGQPFSRFVSPEDVGPPGEPERLLRAAADSGPQNAEDWRVRKDGTRFWADISLSALRDRAGRLSGFAEVYRDISHRRDQDVALRNAQGLFRVLVEGVQDYAICLLDVQGRVTTWNKGIELIKGYTAAEVLGHPSAMFYLPEEVAAKKPERDLEVAVSEGRLEDDGWHLRKDGRRFWANVVIVPIRDHADAIIGFARVTRDISGRREAERSAEERAAALESANAALEAFSYSAAHELRTPVRTACNFALSLERSAGDKLDEKERNLLTAIRSATLRMGELIDGLLTLGHVTRAPVSRVPIDFADIARESASNFERAEPGRKVEWVIPDTLQAEGDPSLLRTVMENLLANAWKFTRTSPHARIEVGRTDVGECPAWYVRDNGAGFDMAHASNLFQPFERLHDAAEFEGMGVGLASVQRIVRRHGGDAWADSSPGKGSTFWFTLAPPPSKGT